MQKSVIEYLERTVTAYPTKTAIRDNKEEITFEQLWHAALKISASIVGLDFGRNKPIGVYMSKSCKMVETFAGINMSGNFYIPLDTKSPTTRIDNIICTLGAELLVTDRSHAELLQAFYKKRVLVLEDIIDCDIDTTNSLLMLNKQIDTDPIYAIFTSGSTGTPKGVVVAHRGVIDYIDWAVKTFQLEGNDMVIGNQAPFYFDNSTLDIYLMYSIGATLDIIPETNFTFPATLVDYLNEHHISFVFWVPFVLINIANKDILDTKRPQYLKDVFFAGEVMPNKHLNYWRRHLPSCRYANLYGPTEITVDCTYYVVDRDFADEEPLPIGFPCRNSDVLILVDKKHEADPNEQGELCVRGSSLALGYYNDWEKTKKAFIQNPLNDHYPEMVYCTGDVVYKNERGEIIYVGRVDSQIKHNGYRIELGEIENVIIANHLVDNCCAIYDFTNKKIALFYQAPEEISKGDFRKGLTDKLPRYMLPTEYHHVNALKLNNSGKIDRAYYKKLINE